METLELENIVSKSGGKWCGKRQEENVPWKIYWRKPLSSSVSPVPTMKINQYFPILPKTWQMYIPGLGRRRPDLGQMVSFHL